MGEEPSGDLTGLVIRVDDRLFHGQILYGWSKGWADEVWLANDRVAADPLERSLYEEQLQGIQGGIVSVEDAIHRYHRRECGASHRCLLIVAGCADLNRLIEGGAVPGEIHLANLGAGEGKTHIAETVNLSGDDCAVIKRLQSEGFSICLRKLPHSKTKPVQIS